MSGRRPALGRLADGGRASSKPLPAILNRKRKNDQEDPSQPDIHSFFGGSLTSGSGRSGPSTQDKDEMVENLRGVSFANIQVSRRPLAASRVPLATLSIASDNIGPDPVSAAAESLGSFALRVPGRAAGGEHKGERRDRKQVLGWKKPKMRKSWSEFRSFISDPAPAPPRGPTPLPELAWADRQEMWELMAKKETGMYRRLSPDALLARHPALQPRMRAILLDWLIEVCEVYRLHRETFYLAVDFIDRFLSLSPAVPKNRLQLIGVSCLFIGAKIEEIYPPKLQEFAYVTDGACTEEEILQMELMVLKGLNWGLSPMTPQAWMKMYFQIAHGSTVPCDSAFSMPAYSGLPFSRVMQLLDLAMLDVGCLEFTYSVLAASALYHSDNETMALHTSGYTFADLAPCVRWMAAAALALRERAPLQPKQFQGIPPDDAHHLQMHSVDLPLLERAQEHQRLLLLGQGARESPDLALQTGLQTLVSGLDHTPQEGEGDVMYPPSHRPGVARPVTHPAPLSPPLDNDIW